VGRLGSLPTENKVRYSRNYAVQVCACVEVGELIQRRQRRPQRQKKGAPGVEARRPARQKIVDRLPSWHLETNRRIRSASIENYCRDMGQFPVTRL